MYHTAFKVKKILFIYFLIIGSFAFGQSDDPCGAPSLTVSASCTFATYTNASASASEVGDPSIPAPGCANYSGGDVWFTVTVPASGNVTVDMNTGVITDAGMAIYSGTCGSLSLIECDDDDSPNGLMAMISLTGQTAGATLWIRIWEYGNNNNGTFDICTWAPTPPPALTNDDPCGSIALTVNSSCSYTTYTNNGASASEVADPSIPAPGCANYSGGDVWFTATIPASGTLIIDSQQGVITDAGMAIYSGTCGSLALIECDDDDSGNGLMSMISISTLPIGSTVYIRFWEYGNNNNGTFDICTYEGSPTGPCGNPLNQDYCDAPAFLSSGTGTFSSNTSGTYSSDTPANLNALFCGSIENNSWYQFTATSATEIFNFSSVTGCTSGIQAEVYNVTTDVNGCCTNFTSMSNCWNPGSATSGTVTAIGLTVGNTYILMVDGFGGDVCDFTVANWTAIGILPVELQNFMGVSLPRKNVINWETNSELNNDHFNLLRSIDAINFAKIAEINGAGNSVSTLEYQYIDIDLIPNRIYYYQLEQVDYNGESVRSEVIAITSSTITDKLLISPNPASDIISVQINSSENSNGTIELINLDGKVLKTELLISNNTLVINLQPYQKGMYIISYIGADGTTLVKKIIKK